jgi:serine/threonine protein kinase
MKFESPQLDSAFDRDMDSLDTIPRGISGSRWLNQVCLDIEESNHLPIPLLGDDILEIVPPEFDSSEMVVLGGSLGTSKTSRVFSLRDHAGAAIKYQSDCEESMPMHPLTREFWMLKKLEPLRISPEAYVLSQGVVPEKPYGAKTETMEKMEGECNSKSSKAAKFRYLIMQKVGKSLSEYAKTRRPLDDALFQGTQMVRLLETLHSQGVVHGDIFPRNVCFRSDRSEELVLIDFGRAMLVKNTPTVARDYRVMHPLLTHWEMMGFRSSFRDDLFRVLQVVAALINGPSYLNSLEILSRVPVDKKTGVHILELFKSSQFIFEMPWSDFRPLSSRNITYEHLEDLLAYTRSLQMDQLPDYELVLTMLQKARVSLQ